MQRENVEATLEVAVEFINRAQAVLNDKQNHYLFSSAKTGALRRQSMELTRMLAKMRKSH